MSFHLRVLGRRLPSENCLRGRLLALRVEGSWSMMVMRGACVGVCWCGIAVVKCLDAVCRRERGAGARLEASRWCAGV